MEKYTILNITDGQPYKIVGIDLTSSLKKPSGYAALENNTATTLRLKTDEDIVKRIVLDNPSIVAIDCPLSLPSGRITVFDDDPGRDLYGINRECERLLRKRGIRCYPPLIKSMQKLTERGIELAGKLRGLGFDVIECYPGAAQDLLGFPRKQKSLELLISKLKDFGIAGDFDITNTVHDEIDAITCALVGLFYQHGHYEAIGNESEGFLIIPLTDLGHLH